MKTTTKTLLLGAALAGLSLSLSGCPAEPAQADEGECHGVNACKGKGDCGSKDHSCAGKNACKGQGWLATNAQDCQAKGGQFKPLGSSQHPMDNPAAHASGAPH